MADTDKSAAGTAAPALLDKPAGGSIKKAAALGVFALAMIEVAAVLSPRNYPSMAEEGWSCITWYIIGLIVFFMPLSLAGAELATGWPKGGGVYAWVREAFGESRGFISIWCEWAENVVWFPTVLSFITATLAYGLFPDLLSHPWLMLVVMLAIFWGITWLNWYGEKYSSKLSSIGGVFGALLPSVILVLLMIVYIIKGKPSAIPFSGAALVPKLDMGTLPFVQTVVLLFAGMEMAGFHALETRNPKKDFPRAIFISAALIFFATTLGTVAIAYTVKTADLSLAGGVMQALKAMLDAVGASWLTVPLTLLLAVGAIAQLSTWLIGPAKGLGTAAAQGDMPKRWRQHNSFGSPTAVLIIQAVISSFLTALIVLLPSVNAAYWILSALTTQIISVMYVLMFAAVIKLRRTQPDTPRAYRIPGGNVGVWLLCGVALAALGFSFVVGLFPPQGEGISRGIYVPAMLVASLVFSAGVPYLIYRFRKPGWRAPNAQAYLDGTEDEESSGSDTAPPGPAVADAVETGGAS